MVIMILKGDSFKENPKNSIFEQQYSQGKRLVSPQDSPFTKRKRRNYPRHVSGHDLNKLRLHNKIPKNKEVLIILNWALSLWLVRTIPKKSTTSQEEEVTLHKQD
ncbi:hypothetical protein AMTR_s00086p00149500 [Amborella trichopoda]|uniref:Uncharacterized protein n=1 Tax=Amborella trichopoda TaxID=13333 RepID=W1P780_AMBTC|nr:hypothetical protein AMTR_s00086p00149500 [Amborella trichopoda]